MVECGAHACFMKDKKGYLPAHVACSRHCSPEKLRMLLTVNPSALHDTTADGHTLLSLATSTATKSHPNYALIDELHRQITYASCNNNVGSVLAPYPNPPCLGPISSLDTSDRSSSRSRLDSNDSNKSWQSNGLGSRAAVEVDAEPLPVATPLTRKRKTLESSLPHAPSDDPVGLLLHFSRNGSANAHWDDDDSSPPMNVAKV